MFVKQTSKQQEKHLCMLYVLITLVLMDSCGALQTLEPNHREALSSKENKTIQTATIKQKEEQKPRWMALRNDSQS